MGVLVSFCVWKGKWKEMKRKWMERKMKGNEGKWKGNENEGSERKMKMKRN